MIETENYICNIKTHLPPFSGSSVRPNSELVVSVYVDFDITKALLTLIELPEIDR